MEIMTETKAIEVLTEVKQRVGRCYKSIINTAWMTGNYYAEGIDDIGGSLQRIRNTFGPSWLAKQKV